MKHQAWLLICALASITGCATPKISAQKQAAEISTLAKNLTALSPQVDAAEARRAADAAVRYPLQLARDWRAAPPAWINNVFVNLGIHKSGLCYQWADALTVKLMTLHLRSLQIHRGVARRGGLREHSCVVLTAPGQSFTNGLALDAWRGCGNIHFASVARDDYPWQEARLMPSYEIRLNEAAEKLKQTATENAGGN